MKKEKKYVYDETFKRKILAVGKISCGKTSFILKIGVNNLFGDFRKVEWVSYIKSRPRVKLKFSLALRHK